MFKRAFYVLLFVVCISAASRLSAESYYDKLKQGAHNAKEWIVTKWHELTAKKSTGTEQFECPHKTEEVKPEEKAEAKA